jgi:hypothetical protein
VRVECADERLDAVQSQAALDEPRGHLLDYLSRVRGAGRAINQPFEHRSDVNHRFPR